MKMLRLGSLFALALVTALGGCSGEAPGVGKTTQALNGFTVATQSLPTAGLTVSQTAKVNKVYIIRMTDDPAISYSGGIANLKATKPAKNQRFDKTSKDVKLYVKYLRNKQDQILSAAGALSSKLYNYTYSFNGVSAALNPAQAKQIVGMPGVMMVSLDVKRTLDTDTSPTFLGLNDQGGIWGAAGGPASAGEDVIIGVIDTGIWPEHPSFSDQSDYVYRPGSSGKKTQVYGPPRRTGGGPASRVSSGLRATAPTS